MFRKKTKIIITSVKQRYSAYSSKEKKECTDHFTCPTNVGQDKNL